MDDSLKEAAQRMEKLNELLAAAIVDRDSWKTLAELADQKLVALQNGVREALEASE